VEFHADTSAPGMVIVSGGKLEHGAGDAYTRSCSHMLVRCALLCACMRIHTHSHTHTLARTHALMRSYTAMQCSYTGAHISSRIYARTPVLTPRVRPYTCTDTVLQCPAGEQMLQNTSMTPTTFAEWKIDCNSVQSMDDGTRYYTRTAPTC
jgi:hypothetical protein